MRPASPKMNNERHWVGNPPHSPELGLQTNWNSRAPAAATTSADRLKGEPDHERNE